MYPINKTTVLIDYKPTLDSFFEELSNDLSSEKNQDSYFYSDFSTITVIYIGIPPHW